LEKFVGKNSAIHRRARLPLRLLLVSGVALTMFAGLTSSADAYYPRGLRYYGASSWYYGGSTRSMRYARPSNREKAEPKKDTGWELQNGPLQLVVNIPTQKVTLYSNGVQIAHGAVSTGVPGHPTPMGVFSIIEKDRYHHSNIYSGAPMPYMQRITWSGVALHEGVVPGHPASHGCIRLQHDFAAKLWPVTKLGVRVLVVRDEVSPADFAHSKLFVPAVRPVATSVALNGETDGRRITPAVRLAQATPTSSEGELELRKTVTMPEPPAGKTIEPATTGTPPEDDFRKPEPSFDPGKPLPPRIKLTDQPAKRSGQVAVFISRKEKKLFVRHGMVPLFDMPITIEQPDQPLGTHVFTAMGATEDGGMRWNLMTIPTDGSFAPERREVRRRSREPAPPLAASAPLKAPSNASEALDRVQMPPQAVERISELLTPGSSLVISDEGLGRETGRYTEFIVLTR
jgi:hypothetical protein